jgi:type VI secretion system protein ImpF
VAELTPLERLQPSLLDRLTDDDPLNQKPEPPEGRVMVKRRQRDSVLRDLAWLFNTTRLEADADLSGVAHVRRAVVNFGLPALSGRSATSLDVSWVERAVRQAILDFEPRVLPPSLSVRAIVHADLVDHHNVIGVEIRGHVWAQPVPLELLVRTEIDLETGEVRIADLMPSRVE